MPQYPCAGVQRMSSLELEDRRGKCFPTPRGSVSSATARWPPIGEVRALPDLAGGRSHEEFAKNFAKDFAALLCAAAVLSANPARACERG